IRCKSIDSKVRGAASFCGHSSVRGSTLTRPRRLSIRALLQVGYKNSGNFFFSEDSHCRKPLSRSPTKPMTTSIVRTSWRPLIGGKQAGLTFPSRLLLLMMLSVLPCVGYGQNAYSIHNLVSDLPGMADVTDTNLVNPWGIAFSGTSPFWISD